MQTTSETRRLELEDGWAVIGPDADGDWTTEGPNHSCIETEQGMRGYFLTRDTAIRAVRMRLASKKQHPYSSHGFRQPCVTCGLPDGAPCHNARSRRRARAAAKAEALGEGEVSCG